MKESEYRFKMHTQEAAHLKIFDVTDKEEMKAFVKDAKNMTDFYNEFSKIVVAIAGGDGTFMNVVQDMLNFKINIKNTNFVPLPFGTSNDISRILKWGSRPSYRMRNNLIGLMDDINFSSVINFDIWNITMKVKEGGDISVPCGKSLVSTNKRIINKLMCHSFSFGLDAYIGINFEQHRTNYRLTNKIRYTWEGIKSLFLYGKNKINKVKDILSTFGKRKTNRIWVAGRDSEEPMLLNRRNKYEYYIGSTNKYSRANAFLRGNPVSFYCTNIPTFMGEKINLWKGGRGRTGLETYFHDPVHPNHFTDKAYMNDNKLEFATFSSVFHLISSKSNRVAQSEGPFQLNFDENIPADTYINIDGEFFKVSDLEAIQIKKVELNHPFNVIKRHKRGIKDKKKN